MKALVAILSSGLLALGILFLPSMAGAQECSNGLCGTPDQSGGGCGCGCGSILIAMTDRGDSYQFADDFDGDGLEDEYDNCAFAANYDQTDVDNDGVGDACDLCPTDVDPFQENLDGDADGNACDDDIDGDGILNDADNCLETPNAAQTNSDLNGLGDACDLDDDDDGFDDVEDPCRLVPNDRITGEKLGTGACDDDPDDDDVLSALDNCPTIANSERNNEGNQFDIDGDGLGDVCDPDADGDGFENFRDNCPHVANPSQRDVDGDLIGDGGFVDGAASCDNEECYVIPGNTACLDPDSAFQIRLALDPRIDPMNLTVGDEIQVVIFTNRLEELHSWTARFDRLPNDSGASLLTARASGTTLEHNAQVRAHDEIRFEADEPGKNELSVIVELPNGDPSNLGPSVANAKIIAEVGGESAGGCAAGLSGSFAALALGLLAFVRRRKK